MNHNPGSSSRMGRRRFLSCTAGGLLSFRLAWGATPKPARKDGPVREASSSRAPLYWAWWGWEPLDHYRRTGGVVGTVDTTAPWMPEWYDRLHSEEIARMMAGFGINLAVTHFFKGFGLEHERAEQQRTAGLVKSAHRHGIKVLGYCQSRSIYHEQFLAEEPDAEDWIQRDEKGRLVRWGGRPYRWAPCINSLEFRAYMKRAISIGLQEVGLDGLHFDNNYSPPCYCRHCERAFRRWLKQRHPRPDARFPRVEFDEVKLPPREKYLTRIRDPLVQDWVRFRCEKQAEYQAELTAHARRLEPDVLIVGNPGYPKVANSAYARSIWAPWLGRQHDLMFAENINFPGMKGGALISQVRAFKHGAAVGYRVISSTWKRESVIGRGLPETADEIGLQIAESAANGGVPGTNWALRPLGEGNKMQVERPDLHQALAHYLQFARTQEAFTTRARPVREIAVLHTFASTTFDNRETVALVQGAEEVLIRGGFAWDVIFGDNLAPLPDYSVLIVAGQSHLSDLECDAIRAFVQEGGSLLLVGENGRYDENGRTRTRAGFDDLRGDRIWRMDAGAVRTPGGPAHEGAVHLPENWTRVVDTIQRAAGTRLSVRLRGSDTVTLNASALAGNRLAAHLVNYSGDPTPQELTLDLGGPWQSCRIARLLTPDAPERRLTVSNTPRPTIAIPAFKTYAVLILE